MNDIEEEGPITQPPPITLPPPNPTAAAVRAEFTDFKRELFAYFDEKESERRLELGIILDQRDGNVLAHFEQMRGEVKTLRRGLTRKLESWETEFRGRTHGFRNAFMAIVGKLNELEERINVYDGKGVEFLNLSDTLKFHSDADSSPPDPEDG